LLLASLLPLYFAFSSTQSVPWYVPALFPGFALFAGYGIAALWNASGKRYRTVVIGFVGFLVSVSLAKSIMFDFQFATEARYWAARWLEQHAARGSVIELGPRHPLLERADLEIKERPMDPRYHAFFLTWRENLAQRGVYQSIRRALLGLERAVAQRLGMPVRAQPRLVGADRAGGFADAVELGAGQPDYIVLVEYLERERIKELEAPNSGYRRVKRIQYEDPLGWNPSFPFLNPRVHVVQRIAAPEQAGE
jgi:hypothetical protein